jgi:2-dehydropantoate 2-reductase
MHSINNNKDQGEAPTAIVIVGAGALGSLIGARLALADELVHLVGRPEHVNRIRQRGLTFKAPGQEKIVHLEASESLADLHYERPIIFLTCKAYDVDTLSSEIARKFGPEVPIFCWQNGIQSEDAAAVHLQAVYGATTTSNAKYLSPGLVIETRIEPCVIGRHPTGEDALCSRISALLTRAGFPSKVSRDILSTKCNKLFGSVMGGVLAAADIGRSEALSRVDVRSFFADLLEETLSVLSQALPNISVAGSTEISKLIMHYRSPPSPQPDEGAEELRFRNSTWQDLALARGRTEAQYFNGEIVRLARTHAMRAPLNEALLKALEQMAKERRPPGYFDLAALRQMSLCTPPNGADEI